MRGLQHYFLLAALATLALSTSGCPGGRCAGISCTNGEACDPADGQCKCGGTICGSNEICDPNLQACVGDLCAARLCPNGNTCDPQDGICKCGGKICSGLCGCDPTSSLCGSCPACMGVICGAGETCDENDLGKCKCHGVECGAGNICFPEDAGGCQPDPCYGVHCSGADEGIQCIEGVCRCGKGNGDVSVSDPVCSRVEHCQDGTCNAILGCDQAPRCYGDELCSPLDLQCHCGSRTGPICAPGEICQSYGGANDPYFNGDAGLGYDGGEFFACRAVDDCHQISCTNGQICDPNQNFNCICETAPDQYGPSCEQNEYCIALVWWTPALVCTPLCNPFVQEECQGAAVGRDAGLLHCYAEFFGDGGTGAAVCETPDPHVYGVEGDPCGANPNCGPGLGCWDLPMSFDGGPDVIVRMCRPYCDTGPGTDGGTHDCLAPLSCTPVGQVQGDGELIQIGFCK